MPDDQTTSTTARGAAARRPMHAGGEPAPLARPDAGPCPLGCGRTVARLLLDGHLEVHAIRGDVDDAGQPGNAFEARQATAVDRPRCSAWPGERQCPRRALEGSTRCGLHPAAYVGQMT